MPIMCLMNERNKKKALIIIFIDPLIWMMTIKYTDTIREKKKQRKHATHAKHVEKLINTIAVRTPKIYYICFIIIRYISTNLMNI